MKSMQSLGKVPVVFFDGYCKLCHSTVHFIIRHEADKELSFASLQSDFAKRSLNEVSLSGSEYATLVFVEDGVEYHRSDAALRIARYLRAPWKYLWYAIYVPRILRDAVYNFVARHRYAVFGKRETCVVPTGNLKSRFLNDSSA